MLGSAAGAGGEAYGVAALGELEGNGGADGAGTGDEVGGHEELPSWWLVGADACESTAHKCTVLLGHTLVKSGAHFCFKCSLSGPVSSTLDGDRRPLGGALCHPLPDSSPGNAPRPRSCASPASTCAPPGRPTCRCARSLASWASSPRRSTGTSAVGTTCSPCW